MSTATTGDPRSLQKELELLRKQGAYETQRREEMMRLLGQEKAIQPVAQEHVAALDRREAEAAQLRAEIASMKSFVQNGASQAKRLTGIVETTKITQSELQKAHADIMEDIKRMKETKESLDVELETTAGAIAKQEDAKLNTESRVQRLAASAQEMIRDIESRRNEAHYIRQQLEECNQVSRRAQNANNAIDSLAGATHRSHHQLQSIYQACMLGAVNNNNPLAIGNTTTAAGALSSSSNVSIIDTLVAHQGASSANAETYDDMVSDQSDYDSDDDAAPSMNGQVIANESKAVIAKCESLLSSIHSVLCRFEGDEKQRLAVSRKQRAELMEQMRSELTDLRLRSDHHLQTMKQAMLHREPLLARYSEIRAQAMQRNTEKITSNNFDGTVPLEKPFNLLEFLEHENDLLEREFAVVKHSNEQLQLKCAQREEDYNAIKELRHAYRDLESKKTLLSLDLRAAEEENKKYKMLLWESGYGLNSSTAAEGGASASRKTKKTTTSGSIRNPSPWKSTVQQ